MALVNVLATAGPLAIKQGPANVLGKTVRTCTVPAQCSIIAGKHLLDQLLACCTPAVTVRLYKRANGLADCNGETI